MRYYRISQTRHDMFLRWFHFDKRRPWLDIENPVCTLTLQLMGVGAGAAQLHFEDRDGKTVAHQVLPGATVPDGLPDFHNIPEMNRQLLQVSVPFSGPTPLYLRRSSDGLLLMTLEPNIPCPDFLFALMMECQSRLCPEGFRNFVETGTLMAHTTLHASYWFDKVWTIELSEALHAQALQSLRGRPNVTCLQGNSASLLPGLAESLTGASFFFLDAHFSGDDDTDWGNSRFSGYPVQTARLADVALPETDRQVPLITEMSAIADLHQGKAAVLVDDWGSIGRRDFGFVGEDWSTLNQVQIQDWIATHPRTAFHFRADPNRYLWAINAIA